MDGAGGLQQQRDAGCGCRVLEPHEVWSIKNPAQPNCSIMSQIDTGQWLLRPSFTRDQQKHGAVGAVAAGDVRRHVGGAVAGEL